MTTDDGSRTLIHSATKVGFHSGCGANLETEHVYLRGSGVWQRLADSQPTKLLEIGVGLGLGLLLSVDHAIACQTPLHYVGVESDWLPADLLSQMHYDQHLQTPNLFERWINQRREFDAGHHRTREFQFGHGIVATILLGEFPSVLRDEDTDFDAVYFDPFDPATNPDLWTTPIFANLRRRVTDHARLTTYCVKRSVRDAATDAAWTIDQVPGPPGGKREVMVASPAMRTGD